MNHDFLIGSAQLNQAFESQESCGGSGQGNGITRRSFVKRAGGAAVAALIAWNASVQSANASIDNNSGVSLYLVCTVAPTAQQLNPPTSTDGPKVYSINLFRKKYDHLICSGPSLGDSTPAVDEAFFEMTAHLLTGFEATRSGQSSGIKLRESKISQKIVFSGDNLIWRTSAVAGNLKDSNGQSGSIDNSGASGGVGMETGTVKAETKWAEPGYGGIITFALSQSGQSVQINPSGNLGNGPMEWSASQVQWQFELMTEDQLNAFLLANWNEIHQQ